MDSQSGSVPGWYLFEACVILDDWFARQMHQFTILRSIFLKGFDLLEQNKGLLVGWFVLEDLFIQSNYKKSRFCILFVFYTDILVGYAQLNIEIK